MAFTQKEYFGFIPKKYNSLPTMESLDKFARSLLETASKYAMEWFLRSSHQIKHDGSPVTAADEAIQKYLIEAITSTFHRMVL